MAFLFSPTTKECSLMVISPKRRKKKTFKAIVRRRIMSGLLVVVPVGLTIFILRFLYQLTAGQLTPMMRPLFRTLPDYVVPAASIVLLLLVTYAVGIVARVFIGRKLIAFMELVLENIPLVKTVYGASKQVVQTLSLQDDASQFKSIVIVDFPRKGMKTFAFVTGKIVFRDEETGEMRSHYRVFVPTTPNPTSGYLEFVPVDEVEPCGISTEDAVKSIISAGLVMPEEIGAPAIRSSAKHDERD